MWVPAICDSRHGVQHISGFWNGPEADDLGVGPETLQHPGLKALERDILWSFQFLCLRSIPIRAAPGKYLHRLNVFGTIVALVASDCPRQSMTDTFNLALQVGYIAWVPSHWFGFTGDMESLHTPTWCQCHPLMSKDVEQTPEYSLCMSEAQRLCAFQLKETVDF